MAQAYGSGEAPELIQQLPGQPPAGLQATSPEPAYKKTKLAHLRVKVPGGVTSTLYNLLTQTVAFLHVYSFSGSCLQVCLACVVFCQLTF